jgi:LysR family transcriptional regulator, nitrogen assimilation regulatory protein
MLAALREIRLFVAAYEERSFTAAAARENATQSGVSQHIRKIEERFKVRLFLRSSGSASIAPTPAGDTYYRKCLDVLRAHDAAAQGLGHFATGLEGEVVIGLMPTMTRSVLAPALARFVESHPNVSLSIAEAYSAVLTERVLAGTLAFAVVPEFLSGVGLRSRLFARTPEVLVTSRQGPAHAAEAGRLAARNPLKLVLPGPQNTRRRAIDTYLASNNIRVDRILELDSMFGTLDLVARTDWVAILPGLMMAADRGGDACTVSPLADPPLWLALVLIESARRVLSPAEQAFLDVLEEETERANWLVGPRHGSQPPTAPTGP